MHTRAQTHRPPTLLVVQLVAVRVAEPTPLSPLSTARTMPEERTSRRNSPNQELRCFVGVGGDGGCELGGKGVGLRGHACV
jgi:hypothetical protein